MTSGYYYVLELFMSESSASDFIFAVSYAVKTVNIIMPITLITVTVAYDPTNILITIAMMSPQSPM